MTKLVNSITNTNLQLPSPATQSCEFLPSVNHHEACFAYIERHTTGFASIPSINRCWRPFLPLVTTALICHQERMPTIATHITHL